MGRTVRIVRLGYISRMPKAPKHHYIPVFYLQQWADECSRLVEYSRQGPGGVVKTRPTSPAGTGYVRGLYRIEDVDPSVVNVVETLFLKPSDGLAAEALQSFLQGEAFPRPCERHGRGSSYRSCFATQKPSN
jgi:Protein of unknown function (DUF4238)